MLKRMTIFLLSFVVRIYADVRQTHVEHELLVQPTASGDGIDAAERLKPQCPKFRVFESGKIVLYSQFLPKMEFTVFEDGQE
jgi:hypothetical protein